MAFDELAGSRRACRYRLYKEVMAMKKKVITISREFGSGGRTVGKLLADKLGWAYYDKELIEKVQDETGFSKEFIEENGEYSPSKSIFSYAFIGRDVNGVSMSDYVWNAQRKVILELADKEPCVIVGRCADYILRDRKDVLHTFIHADIDFRKNRIVEVYGETDETPEKRLRDKDKKREINYKYYTDREWGICRNYDIALDSGNLGIESCVNIIAAIIQGEE